MPGGGLGPGGGRGSGGGLEPGGTDVRSFVRSFVRSLGRTEITPLCSIGHRPLRVRCPKGMEERKNSEEEKKRRKKDTKKGGKGRKEIEGYNGKEIGD